MYPLTQWVQRLTDMSAEPLRRGDLLNLIAKFSSEQARQRGHPIPVDVS